METMDAIFSRRSIRSYKKNALEDDLVDLIIKAGMHAPSARNLQPWHFLCVKRRELLDNIPEFHPYAKMIYGAPLAVVVAGDLTIEESVAYINQDCSAATENMLLAAHTLGLGAVWLGIYPREERVNGVKKLLSIPDHILPVSIVVLGYPDEKKGPADRYRPDRIHLNTW